MSDYTLVLADGSSIQADIDGEISKWVKDLLASGKRVNVRSDGKDVSGHAADGTIGIIIYGDDDTEGHALTLRLPNTEAARDLQKKVLATGALVGVIVVGAVGAQVAPDLSVGTVTPAGASVTRTTDWDQSHAAARANPSVAGTRDAGWDQAHATGAAAAAAATPGANVGDGAKAADGIGAAAVGDNSAAVIGGAVHPGQTRDDLRTDASTRVSPPASANPLVRDGQADMGASTRVSPPASANPLVRDGQADMGTAAAVDATGGTVRGYDAAQYGGGQAREAFVAEHGTTNAAATADASSAPWIASGQSREAWIAEHGITNAPLAGKAVDDATMAAAATSELAGKTADDAALAVGSSELSGKAADDAVLPVAADDEASNPPVRTDDYRGR